MFHVAKHHPTHDTYRVCQMSILLCFSFHVTIWSRSLAHATFLRPCLATTICAWNDRPCDSPLDSRLWPISFMTDLFASWWYPPSTIKKKWLTHDAPILGVKTCVITLTTALQSNTNQKMKYNLHSAIQSPALRDLHLISMLGCNKGQFTYITTLPLHSAYKSKHIGEPYQSNINTSCSHIYESSQPCPRWTCIIRIIA